jgi:hypothetical protein
MNFKLAATKWQNSTKGKTKKKKSVCIDEELDKLNLSNFLVLALLQFDALYKASIDRKSYVSERGKTEEYFKAHLKKKFIA